MPEKFVVPQFIDNEDKILGPITVRQFLVLLVATFLIFIEYSILQTVYFIISALITAAIFGTFGFAKINGQYFHMFFVNFVQTYSRSMLRVWHKDLPDNDLRELIKAKPVVLAEKRVQKDRPSSTKLRDLALTVNTGGVYNSEEDSEL